MKTYIIICSLLLIFQISRGQGATDSLSLDYDVILKNPTKENCRIFLNKYRKPNEIVQSKYREVSNFNRDLTKFNKYSEIIEEFNKSINENSFESFLQFTKKYNDFESKNTYGVDKNELSSSYIKQNFKLNFFTEDRSYFYLNSRLLLDSIDKAKFSLIIRKIDLINNKIETSFQTLDVNKIETYNSFKDTFNTHFSTLLKLRDDLEGTGQLKFKTQSDRDTYLNRNGFDKSYMRLKDAMSMFGIQKKYLTENTLNLSIEDINSFAIPFPEFNPFSDLNHKAYWDILSSINKNVSNDMIISLFDLNEKYTTPLQKENFISSPDFKKLLIKRDSMRNSYLSNIYMIDLSPSDDRVGELILDMFIISKYDLAKGGFTIKLGTYKLSKFMLEEFNTIIPNVIHRICFDVIPFKNILDPTYDFNYNSTFIPIDKNTGGKIEEAGQNLRVKLLFQLDKTIKPSGNKNVGDYLKASVCKLIFYNITTSEILYSKIYKPSANQQKNIKSGTNK
ncbi:MAG TPA: hypothetical protein PK784_08295 [Tenuifilaceae bacterium]|nr:hypothetical protein [Tenuifilaceae bacterium]